MPIISVLLNPSQGGFTLANSLPIGFNVASVQVADMDLDGDQDIIASAGKNGFLVENRCLPGDANGNGNVDLLDQALTPLCLSGPDIPSAPGCPTLDFDLNGDADLEDWALFQLVPNP